MILIMPEPIRQIDPVNPATGRWWRGRPLSPVMEAQLFFDDQGPVPETYRRLRESLEHESIPFVIIGAMAVNAHGFVRATSDINICMRRADLQRFKQTLVGKTFLPVEGRPRHFIDAETRTNINILISGEIAGRRDRNHDILFPDPDETEIHNAAPTVSLARLIELKLVTWRLRDWADVIDLIRHLSLNESFAQNLHLTVRSAYLQCYDQRMEEDKYHPELQDD